MPAIEICSLTRRFGNRTAVDALNLSVNEGELLALLGVNGAEAGRAAMSGSPAAIARPLLTVALWTILLLFLAVAAFSRRMSSGRK